VSESPSPPRSSRRWPWLLAIVPLLAAIWFLIPARVPRSGAEPPSPAAVATSGFNLLFVTLDTWESTAN
jgi:hypothetical protein